MTDTKKVELSEKELEKVGGGYVYDGVEYNHEFTCYHLCVNCGNPIRTMWTDRGVYSGKYSPKVYVCSNCGNVEFVPAV